MRLFINRKEGKVSYHFSFLYPLKFFIKRLVLFQSINGQLGSVAHYLFEYPDYHFL